MSKQYEFRNLCRELGRNAVLYALEEVASRDFAESFHRENWSVVHNPDFELITSNDSPPNSQLPYDEAYSRLITYSCRIDAMVSMLKTLTTIATDIQKQYTQALGPYAQKFFNGIASLPDELLSMIFEFSVRSEGIAGPTQALRLSHVSRKFRTVALADPDLWTTVRSNAPAEELKMFLSRAGADSDLHAFILVNEERDVVKWGEFLEFSKRTVFRWSTFTFAHGNQYSEADSDFILKMFNGDDDETEWIFPRLRELDILGNSSRPVLSWKCPNLHTLRCTKYYLPGPSPTFSSVTSFTCWIPSRTFLEDLPEFVASMPRVENLDLAFGLTAEYYYRERGPHFVSPSTSHSVVNLQLRFSNFLYLTSSDFPDMCLERLIAAFLHALHLPNLKTYSISGRVGVFGEENDEDVLSELSQALLPINTGEHPTRLSTLEYKFSKLYIEPSSKYDNPAGIFPFVFTIPLGRIPAVSSITVETCTRVAFSRAASGVQRDGHDNDNDNPSGSRLREVRFRGCEYMENGDLESAIRSLKDAGVWETLERLVVEDCNMLDYSAALKVVGKDKLEYRV